MEQTQHLLHVMHDRLSREQLCSRLFTMLNRYKTYKEVTVMAKIVVHPEDPTMYMFWDIGLEQPSAFYISGDQLWKWNENYASPTVYPSVLLCGNDFRSHLFIQDGKLKYLSDCSHSYAGKTVDMVEFPPDWV